MMPVFWNKAVSLSDEKRHKLFMRVLELMRINSNTIFKFFCLDLPVIPCILHWLMYKHAGWEPVGETCLFYILPFHQLPQELLYLPGVHLDPSALLVRPLHEHLVFHYHPVAEITGKKTSGNFIFNL